ncbi:MAG: ATP-dependent metalloprotease, partial [Pseudomonadota bacterium]|nr:ATP-dependent metalloprotease [Pseudomonadota bacterium]
NIVDKNYKRSERLLKKNVDKLHLMADALIKYETIDADQIDDIMKGKAPRPPSDWNDSNDQNTLSKKKTKKKTRSSKKNTAPSGEPPAKPA